MQRWMTVAIAAASLAATGLAQAGDHSGHDFRGSRDAGGHGLRGGHESRGNHEFRGGHESRGRYEFRGGHDYRRGNEYRGGHDYRADTRRHPEFRGSYSYRSSHGSWHPVPRYVPSYGYSSYAGPGWRAPHYHVWGRGSYLPRAYFEPRYYVTDYAYFGLAPPPIGYTWVRVNGDFLLAALATGFVADALFGGY